MKVLKGYTVCISSEGGPTVRYFCRECGQEIPADSDFCYSCGALKKTAMAVDDSGAVQQLKSGVCPYCGRENDEGSEFCGTCGKPLSAPAMQIPIRRKLTGKEKIAIGLAVIPGVFSIFGLGHIALKKFSRAFLYLAISAIWIYLYYFYVRPTGSMLFLWMLFEFFVYFRQCMEVIGLVYFRGPDDKRGP